MAGTYEEALDSCITQLMQGKSLDACLALYPEYAPELEADLRPLQRELSAISFAPSESAKRRGRLMLEQEIARLEGAESSAQGWWEWLKHQASKLAPAGQRRWAIAVPAVLLILVLGGAVTTSAAGSAVPGDLLYPVKRTTEEAQLAFSSSDFNRAKRQIEFAQRRADEIEEITGTADDELVLATSRQLSEHLADAARITSDIEDDSDAQQLASLLKTGASQTLSSIEQTIATVSGNERLAQALDISGKAYGQAVESAGARNEASYVAGPPGMLRVQATDPPPEGVDRLLVEITNIDVFLPAGSQSKWVALLNSPITVDLIQAATTPQLLTQVSVESGAYSRLRITFNTATVVIAGKSQEITVQQGSAELVRPFQVLEDQITTLTLDFDGAASLQSLSGGQFSLTPVVHLFAEEPVSAQIARGNSEATPTPSPGQTPAPTAAATLVELQGIVEASDSGSITVNGIRITLDQNSSVSGGVQTGANVAVQAWVTGDGNLLAVLVTVIDEQSNFVTPTPVAGSEVRTTVEGMITAIEPGLWSVGGRDVVVTAATEILIAPVIGAFVRVDGELNDEGAVVALRISLSATTPGATPMPRPTADPSATPSKTDPTPGAINVDFTGKLTAIEGASWQVNGYAVLVTTSTAVSGVPLIGKTVRVEGILAGDGSVIAHSVTFVVAVPTVDLPVPTAPPAVPTATSLVPTLPPLPGLPPATPTPTASPIATPASTPTTTPTAQVTTPTPLPSATPSPTPVIVVVEGVIVSITGDSLVVGSTTVIVTSNTSVTGLIAVGVTARVIGALQLDGIVLAESIAIESDVPLF